MTTQDVHETESDAAAAQPRVVSPFTLHPSPFTLHPSPLTLHPSLFLTSPWLTIRVQLALGVIFVVAALPKLLDPPSFAHMIYNYRIVPGPLVNMAALIMPWIEILSGLALILGIWRTTARTIIAFLLAVFIIAISINLARGNVIDCGCFDVTEAAKTAAQRLADMRLVILRDLGMLLMVAQLWWAERKATTQPSLSS